MLSRRCVTAGLIASISAPATLVRAQDGISSSLLDEFLKQGQWGPDADDNVNGEALTADLLRRLVQSYCDDPNSKSGRRALGLFVLALSIAEWGVSDPNGLWKDPHGTRWASDSNATSGKHLMSYSIGGIGIFHADGGRMIDFVRRISELPELSDAQRQELLNVIAAGRYSNGKVTFDKLRAASVCRQGTPTLGDDALGKPFAHHAIRGGSKYCSRFFDSPQLRPRDWIVFKTWARFALRRRDIQERLISDWLEEYWDKSLLQLEPGDGREEEAFINVRFRNSLSGAANGVKSPPGTPVTERIAYQMRAYRLQTDRVLRRVGIIQRPVVLYRQFTDQSEIKNFRF